MAYDGTIIASCPGCGTDFARGYKNDEEIDRAFSHFRKLEAVDDLLEGCNAALKNDFEWWITCQDAVAKARSE